MSLSTNKIIVNDDPVDENDIVNKRYVSNNFIKTTITPDDIPNTNLLDTNFSFKDMANDILYLEDKIFNNPALTSIIRNYINFNNTSYAATIMSKINLLLTNICRNFANDPDSVCYDPDCFYKKVQLLTANGQPFAEATTYKAGVVAERYGLNLNKDFIYAEFKDHDIFNNDGQPFLVHNPQNLDISNITEIGVTRKRRITCYTNVDVDSNGNYLYPLNVSNPISSHKIPIKYEIAIGSHSQDVADAVKNGWGWLSKISAVKNNLPSYFMSYNSSIPVPGEEYAAIIRLSYHLVPSA